jgi:hypothetical protein
MSRSTTIGTGHTSSVHAAILASIPPGDCEFSPPDAETVLVVEKLEALTPDASAEAMVAPGWTALR